MTQPVSDTAPTLPAPPARSTLAPKLLLLSLAAAAAVWYFWLARPQLVFTNQLAAPVRLVADGKTRTVQPGETVRWHLARARTTVAEWQLVRPLAADGKPMGAELRGSVVAPRSGRRLREVAESWGRDADYFAPLITNATDEPLRVVVNAGLQNALDCGCAVRPGARQVFIGYYPLYQNSTVQASATGARRATFHDLGREVKARDGTVGLRFGAEDLRP